MKEYDAIVVGSGAGIGIVEQCLSHGLKVALVDRGPLGGTCLNIGCIPSKMLIAAADSVVAAQESARLGVSANVNNIDYKTIMTRMKRSIRADVDAMCQSILNTKNLDLYEAQGRFIAPYTLEVAGEQLKAKMVFLASGSRPVVPAIKGLAETGYLTNETLLELEEPPKSLLIIGGGYIGVEFGHFFAAMGTQVTIIEMGARLVANEEPEVSDLLKKSLARRMAIHTSLRALEFSGRPGDISLLAQDVATGQARRISANQVLLAAGRQSNAASLDPEKTGVRLTSGGYIAVNSELMTSQKNIWAIGDATGQQMFTHAANRAAQLAVGNALHGTHKRMDWQSVPHAVFSHPQIASVGLTEAGAAKEHNIAVGRALYADTARGQAMGETEGFAKAIIDTDSNRLLGFHIIGPEASSIIQEVVNVMSSGGRVDAIFNGLHIHPALPELVLTALSNLEKVPKARSGDKK